MKKLLIMILIINAVCEEPPDIDFGEVVSGEKVSYQENDRIQYRCSPGYALEGSEWIICNDQKWTLPPKCLGKRAPSVCLL